MHALGKSFIQLMKHNYIVKNNSAEIYFLTLIVETKLSLTSMFMQCLLLVWIN